MSTIFDSEVAVRVTNTTETPFLIKRNTQIAEFSVVIPEQAKFIKPVEVAILSMIPEGDLHLTTFLNEPLRTNKPDTFWFLTPKNLGKIEKIEYLTPIQTGILKELYELKEKNNWIQKMTQNPE